jgi:hypothetical protein
MKRLVWSAIGVMTLGIAVLFAVSQVEQSRMLDMPSMMPDGALLFLQARDFRSLLKDWNSSAQKRAWLSGENYQAFSRSRLFDRLSQAQDEFSAAAGLKTDSSLLDSVAGTQTSLALYDIGNLEFIYVTRMEQHDVDSTPLWQLRAKFEPRTETGVQFFVHQDAQSNRTAAFAAKDGWLILSTSERLMAGVLDRIQATQARSLADDSWYADAVKQAPSPPDDLRMVLNLGKIVTTPYFRSYWVQRNITEMKQYTSALSDLHRSAETYREERVLVRKAGLSAAATGDVQAVAALAPAETAFYSAQASPEAKAVLTAMRENLLEMKPEQATSRWSAPSATTAEKAGDASMLEEHIDQAPVIVKQADAYQPLRALLRATELTTLLEVYATSASRDGVFVAVDRGMVMGAAENWNEAAVQESVTAALQPRLTTAHIGVGWTKRSGASGDYFAIDGPVSLYAAVREKLLLMATDRALLEHMLARIRNATQSNPNGITYRAVFRHDPTEQQNFRALFARLDTVGHSATADASAGQTPSFFSGNIASLGTMFSSVNLETIEERDQGSKVTQTVIYQWNRK